MKYWVALETIKKKKEIFNWKLFNKWKLTLQHPFISKTVYLQVSQEGGGCLPALILLSISVGLSFSLKYFKFSSYGLFSSPLLERYRHELNIFVRITVSLSLYSYDTKQTHSEHIRFVFCSISLLIFLCLIISLDV